MHMWCSQSHQVHSIFASSPVIARPESVSIGGDAAGVQYLEWLTGSETLMTSKLETELVAYHSDAFEPGDARLVRNTSSRTRVGGLRQLSTQAVPSQ